MWSGVSQHLPSPRIAGEALACSQPSIHLATHAPCLVLRTCRMSCSCSARSARVAPRAVPQPSSGSPSRGSAGTARYRACAQRHSRRTASTPVVIAAMRTLLPARTLGCRHLLPREGDIELRTEVEVQEFHVDLHRVHVTVTPHVCRCVMVWPGHAYRHHHVRRLVRSLLFRRLVPETEIAAAVFSARSCSTSDFFALFTAPAGAKPAWAWAQAHRCMSTGSCEVSLFLGSSPAARLSISGQHQPCRKRRG